MPDRKANRQSIFDATDLATSDNKEAIAAIRKFLERNSIFDSAAVSAPRDVNAVLALATLKLEERDPDAARLFASVTEAHDVREAWIGLAIAHYWQADTRSAAQALAHALSCHAVTTVPPVA